MKGTGRSGRKSLYWSRLLGLLISFAIIAVLVFGGMNNLMGELSHAYQALADSQSELAVARHELAETKGELATAEGELAAKDAELAGKSSALHLTRQQLADNLRVVEALVNEQYDLKRALGEAASQLADSNRQLAATQNALRETGAELDRLQRQPTLSVVVTTERYMETRYRERFAAEHVQMLVAGDGGGMFYDGKTMQHEVEESAVYAERTQMIITQTAPGHDVLDCLDQGCALVLGAHYSAAQMEAYSYQSQVASMESLLVMEDADRRRRGRHPGRRR